MIINWQICNKLFEVWCCKEDCKVNDNRDKKKSAVLFKSAACELKTVIKGKTVSLATQFPQYYTDEWKVKH